MALAPYAPLWCKSNGSFLEGASHPEELVEEAYRLGLSSLAITDRDGIYGIVRAHLKAQEVGIHLIIGSPDHRRRRLYDSASRREPYGLSKSLPARNQRTASVRERELLGLLDGSRRASERVNRVMESQSCPSRSSTPRSTERRLRESALCACHAASAGCRCAPKSVSQGTGVEVRASRRRFNGSALPPPRAA